MGHFKRPVRYVVRTGKRPVRSESAKNIVVLRAEAPGLYSWPAEGGRGVDIDVTLLASLTNGHETLA